MIQDVEQHQETAVLKSAQTVLTVLKAFDRLPYEASLSEVIQVVDVPKMKVHRALHTLVSAGFLHQNSKSKKFRLHHSVLALARKFQNEQSIRMLSHDILQELALAIGEDITVAVVDDSHKEVIFVDRIYGEARISFYCDVGRRLPLHVGAAAKAILAHLPDNEFETYLKDLSPVELTPYTIKSASQIRMERNAIRQKGYSFSNQEVDEGVSALGACILDRTGYPSAGVAIASLHVKMTDQRVKELGERLRKAVSEISSYCGYGVVKDAAFKN